MAKELKIGVIVIPPCISVNRENQYVEEAIRAYKRNPEKLPSNIEVLDEKYAGYDVVLEFYR